MATKVGEFLTDLSEAEYLERMVDELNRVGRTPERIERHVSLYLSRASIPGASVSRNGQALTITLPDRSIRRTVTSSIAPTPNERRRRPRRVR